ncbi:hypothetical protein FHS85_001574 [Rhodoligotrophos appendicifer]|uniref:2OG-Fe(II) oxygenase n=1 Tax=Rhodoligotrophos appendicifer TaxID=987056 RepID=UPI0014794741|nr:2OG-Fe(II) oxygenase [Rhodoligotrophos appendicifer]
MDPFIRWYDDALSPELCREIVTRFDKDKRRMVGKVSGNKGPEVDLKGKQTTELILPDDGWADIKQELQKSLAANLALYTRDVKYLAGSDHREVFAEPLRVKKYEIGGQFSWHIDNNSSQNQTRTLAVQWYFNDVAEGGRTEFEDQHMGIDCVEGRLAFFPVGWTYRHRGAPPASGPKYVCTTFLHRRF